VDIKYSIFVIFLKWSVNTVFQPGLVLSLHIFTRGEKGGEGGREEERVVGGREWKGPRDKNR